MPWQCTTKCMSMSGRCAWRWAGRAGSGTVAAASDGPGPSCLCFACCSIWTTSRMVGRSTLCSCTHSIATNSTCAASATGTSPPRRGSSSPSTPPPDELRPRAHCTRSTAPSPSPRCSPTGFSPVTSSSSTTPKLYTSLFSSTFSVYAYSAASQPPH